MAVEAKTEASLIRELGATYKKLSPFIYFGLFPLLRLIVALLFAGLANGPVSAATDSLEVRVGSELEFPPYAFVDESGRPAGFSVDLIKAVADVMGLSIKISTGPWDTVWNELVAGRLDVLPIVAKLPERQRLVDFSIPHTETYDAFFVRQGNPEIQNIEAARGKEIVVMRSDAAHHAIVERNFQGRLILVETIPAGLSLISSGKHDAFLCSKLIGTMVIKKYGLKNLDAGPPIPNYKRVFSFAVRKGDAELLEKLNQGLLIIKTNREYDRIYEKWLTAGDPWQKLQKYLWPAIVFVIAIALIVGFWLGMLQLLVKKRTLQLSESNELLRLAQEGLEERVARRTVELAEANVALQSEITERTRLEEARRKAHQELQAIIQASPLSIFVLDPEGKVLLWNAASEKIFGWTEAEAVGCVLPIVPEEKMDEFRDNLRRALSGEPLRDMELRRRRRDGTPIDIRIYTSTLYDSQGQATGVMAVNADITERKQIENALHEEHSFRAGIIKNVAEGICVCHQVDDYPFIRFTVWNDRMTEITGYTMEEINRLGWYQTVYPNPEVQEKVRERMEGMRRGDDLRNEEWEIVRADGEKRILEISTSLFTTEKSGGHVLALMQDITDRKKKDEELLQAYQDWEETFQAIGQLTIILDSEHNILRINRNTLAATGRSEEELLGKKCYELFHAGLDRPAAGCPLEKMILSGHFEAVEMEMEALGGIFLVSCTPMLDERGCLKKVIHIATDITARKQAENELLLKEKLLDGASDSIFLHDMDGHFLYVNEAAYRDRGYEKEELLAIDLPEIVAPEFAGLRKQLLNDLLVKGEIVFESAHLRKDRSYMPVEIHARILELRDRKLILSAARDITERKQAEAALRASEEKLQSIFRAAPVGIGMVVNRVFSEVNQWFCDLTGYGREELIGQSARLVYPSEEEYERVGREKYAQFALSVTGEVETQFRRKDGTVRNVLLRSSPRDPADLSVGVIFTALDITERKRAEETLQESEEKYRLLVNQIPAVVYIGYPDWSLDCFDRKIEELTGYAKEDFDSRRRTWLDLVFPEDIDKAKKRFRAAVKGDGSYVTEHRIRNKTGEVSWIQARNRIILDAAGKVEYISGVFFDITERKKMEDQLSKAQKMEVVGLLAGGVAHDFNNLLTAIMGYSDMIMMRLRQEDPLYPYVQEISKAAARGASLTHQLLAFSRKQILQPQVVNLNEVVLGMENMLRRLIGEDIDLLTSIDQELGFVKADPGQIEQIIMNLAVNAREAMPHGGNLTIETANVSLDQSYTRGHIDVSPGPYVMLAMSDNGLGMDAGTISHIFEPFFTTKETGKGTGLGLATVYGIVKQSGGHIWVYSEPGQGTTFKIYLPRVEELPEEAKPKAAAPAFLGGNETILVVEDDAVLRELISTALRTYGFTVMEAEHGGEALLICEREQAPIHLMLTDVVMPQMSGSALAERLKQLHPEMKIIFMSGYTENAIVHHGVLYAQVNFIPKPFKMLALMQKIREVLDTT